MPAERTSSSTSSRGRTRSLSDIAGGTDRPMSQTCCPCRAKKIKCDSRSAPCTNCLKTGGASDCTYRTKLKPGLRAGGQQETSKRLDALEAMIAMHARRFEQLERLGAMHALPPLYSHHTAAPLSDDYCLPSPHFTSHRPADIKIENPFVALNYLPSHPVSAPLHSTFPPEFDVGVDSTCVNLFSPTTPSIPSTTCNHHRQQPYPTPPGVATSSSTCSSSHSSGCPHSPIYSNSSGTTMLGENQDLPSDDVIQNLYTRSLVRSLGNF